MTEIGVESCHRYWHVLMMILDELIKSKLEPVLLEFGFERAPSSGIGVWTYMSKHLTIAFYHDPRGELSSTARAEGSDSVPLWMLFEAIDPDYFFAGSITGNDPSRIGIALENLAELIQRHPAVMTTPADQLIQYLVDRQRQSAQQAWQLEQLNCALREADKQWKAKRYSEFATTLEPWERFLSPATLAKLQFSLKKIGSS